MSWINDYTPLELDLLQSLDDTINSMISELEANEEHLNNIQIEMNTILPTAEKNRAIVEELNEILTEEYINDKFSHISSIDIRKGIIAPPNNGKPSFNSTYYPEFQNESDDKKIFSAGSFWLILN